MSANGYAMTKLEDEISSVRTLRHANLAMFIMSEIICVISAYKWNINPGLHFTLIAFLLPLMAPMPYLVSWQGERYLRRVSDEEVKLPTQLALSRQLSFGVITAYSLFIFAMAVAGATNS
jgi:hypothetical protein